MKSKLSFENVPVQLYNEALLIKENNKSDYLIWFFFKMEDRANKDKDLASRQQKRKNSLKYPTVPMKKLSP